MEKRKYKKIIIHLLLVYLFPAILIVIFKEIIVTELIERDFIKQYLIILAFAMLGIAVVQ